MRPVILLGSTGSIGRQALEVIAAHRDRFQVKALGAGGGHIKLLAAQAAQFSVSAVGIADAAQREDFISEYKSCSGGQKLPEIFTGPRAMEDLLTLASPQAVVLNGITGSRGLGPTLAALHSGATLALANKESLVAGGKLVAEALQRPGQIVPVDSEHSAIAQCLSAGRHRKGLVSPEVDGTSEVTRLILTASGGPFRGKKRSELAEVTPAQALAHPTWNMGAVVTINSSTLMNKALELIEAAHLFAIPPQDIVPVVHPQSVVHSMVEFQDGATIAQASPPDMRLPIALGLSWPERLVAAAAPCQWDKATHWDFAPVDSETFPALDLARAALAASPLHPAVLNAANEECVDAFLREKLAYLAITEIVEKVLTDFSAPPALSLAEVLHSEDWARQRAWHYIKQEKGR